ncbi:sugar kinase [Paenibacillus hemerocallicola]|jgi:2-dehydro-3-deoxygluconokinase|uniref:Sugar kinase n=1 Tax=Paenibacillus hemerocallicola TaxID=1172614 RepID=A0A5C4SZ13_9BACL|nr:sugar kinase [Paenibacillus hemerocallicola]TNJ62011.1 sugar kinase [Paenibacillus hemerocallicola]
MIDERPNHNGAAEAPEVVTFGETMGLMMPTGVKGIEYSAQFEKSFAGAESNVAIGVARLGHRVGWFGHLGADPLGRYALKQIRGEGVDVTRARLVEGAPTGLIIREVVGGKSSVFYYRRHSAASLMRPEHVDEAYISQAKLLHVTGITPALGESCRDTVREAVRLARKHGVKVCFDPNLRLKLWSAAEARSFLLPLAEEADYFLPGLDELKLLYETEDFDTIVERLGKLQAVSIVKGGEDCTYVVENGSIASVPYFKAEHVVDTVGAGDGFCAGFIAGLLKQYTHVEAVRIGNLIGSMVVQAHGDWEGLPTWAQVRAVLNNETHVER